jgi:leucyl/phenylalanyl-tRNA--protein transferase
MPVFLLNDTIEFPSPDLASDIGLLAVGGDLSRERLLLAYQMGIFPWFSQGEPIMWWSPDPRLVLYPEELLISRSLKKALNRGVFQVTMNSEFDAVIRSCAQIRRKDNEGTWILEEMVDAYNQLHAGGVAHSIEVWYEGELAGGLYGVALGGCFFGESMFSRISNASKVAFVRLIEHLRTHGFHMVDCQVTTDHLKQFGAREIPRSDFLSELKRSLAGPRGTLLAGSRFNG